MPVMLAGQIWSMLSTNLKILSASLNKRKIGKGYTFSAANLERVVQKYLILQYWLTQGKQLSKTIQIMSTLLEVVLW